MAAEERVRRLGRRPAARFVDQRHKLGFDVAGDGPSDHIDTVAGALSRKLDGVCGGGVEALMPPVSYARHRFPPAIIQHVVWQHLRFTLSLRDVEDLLAVRGLDISCETVRRWVITFGLAFAKRPRASRLRPTEQWHLEEVVITIAGRHLYLWLAVDDEGEVLVYAAANFT